jgi:transcription termination factor Rho
MTERRRPHRRGGRGPRSYNRTAAESNGEPNPYRDGATETPVDEGDPIDNANAPPPTISVATEDAPAASPPPPPPPAPAAAPPSAESSSETREQEQRPPREDRGPDQRPPREHREHRHHHRDQRGDRNENGSGGRQHNQQFNGNGRRSRRNRGRGRQRDHQQHQPPTPVVADSETQGWFDPSRDGGFIRRAANSYLAEAGDAYVAPHLVRQYGLRRGDTIVASTGRDHRGRSAVVELLKINDQDPALATRRPDFGSLTATYPERKLHLETGRPAKGGPELTRRAIDLIAPIGYGQRALIVAPARAGKTMLLHAITEGIAINHPNATLLILLVDERPEEVSEAISWGVGEVIASSFDQPADRHVEVTEMVLEHARRLVEMGKDVVIVLDSLTRMARAHNTAERGTGRTLSGGLDSSAMAKPKAFFGSARAVAAKDGGGSLTIISTALVETGSRMDDVIFEEFKGTGNCEIKLDRSLAEKRIFPAFDIATSGTRREEKLYKPEQLDAVYTLRRGLQQMPPQAAMEWMIKRIANTPNNDALLAGL